MTNTVLEDFVSRKRAEQGGDMARQHIHGRQPPHDDLQNGGVRCAEIIPEGLTILAGRPKIGKCAS